MSSNVLRRIRTWLMRGGAVAIVAALVGAWALGLAEAGDKGDDAPPPNVVQKDDRNDAPDYEVKRSGVVDKAEERRTRDADPTQDAGIEQVVDTVDTTDEDSIVDGGDTDPSPSDDPTPDSPDSGWEPDDDPTTPTQPPTNPPTQPEDECTDLMSSLNCVIDGVLGGGQP